MPEAHVGTIPEGLKPCPICAEPINQRAWKCIHCQSELGGWRRRLGISSTILALLVALISVLTAAVPVLKDTLTRKNSDVDVSFQGADANIVSVVLSNRGTRPGSFRGALLVLQNPGEVSVYLTLDAPTGGPAVVLGAGQAILFNLFHFGSHEDSFQKFVFKNDTSCFLSYRLTDFLGATTYLQKQIECDELKSFVSGHQRR